MLFLIYLLISLITLFLREGNISFRKKSIAIYPPERPDIAIIRCSGVVGREVIVDRGNADLLEQFAWSFVGKYPYLYANTTVRCPDGSRNNIRMHRLILGLDSRSGGIVDHINGCTLDNRRENLRVVDHSTNMKNWHTHGFGFSKRPGRLILRD